MRDLSGEHAMHCFPAVVFGACAVQRLNVAESRKPDENEVTETALHSVDAGPAPRGRDAHPVLKASPALARTQSTLIYPF